MDFEYALVFKKLISVYKVDPPTSEGYFASQWKEGRLTVVNLKVIAKGDRLRVDLLNGDESLYVSTPIPEDYREAVIKSNDSSRAYVLRVQNPKGGYLWLGLKFNDRNDGFDFFACLIDFAKNRELEKNPTKFKDEFKPSQDFSLQKGEKIKLGFGGSQDGGSKQKNSSGGFGLAPPPSNTTSGKSTTTTTTTTFQNQPSNIKPSGGSNDWDFGGQWGSTNNTTTTTSKSNNDFTSWDFGGGSKTQQTQGQQDPFAGFSFGQPTQSSSMKPNTQQQTNSDPFGFGISANTANTNTTTNNQPKKQETVNLLDL